MIRINIKPLSVNDAWQGRRFRSKKYQQYKRDLSFLLPKLDISNKGHKVFVLNVGFSSRGCDLDNIIKPFLDVVSKKYGFNDNQVYKIIMEKKIVPKGKEFIEFDIRKS